MKRISIFCLLLVVLASLSGCNIPTPPPSSGTTPTIQAITPISTGSGTPGGVTPPPLPSFTPLTGTVTPGVTPPPLPSFTPITGTVTPGVTPPPPPTFTVPVTEMPTPSGAINLDLLKNFTYTVESPDLKVPLKDGVYSGDHITSKLVEPVAFGNLAGEGAPDAVVVLATNTGGSGTFFDLVAVLDNGGTPVQAGYAPFGDRQVVKNLQIVAGRIVLDYLTQGPKDGLCCPSEHRLRTYVLDGRALRLASEQVLDSPETQATMVPHVIEIDQPVNGDSYTSPLPVRGRISEVPPEKKLGYRVTDFLSGYLLMEGDVPVEGEPGQPGTFAFELSPGPVTPGIIILAIVDVESGKLLGRSVVELSTPHQ